jgi:TatD DNase family protein
MALWIDTHCHLDAPDFAHDVTAVREAARDAGVGHCVYPAVLPAHFEAISALAHQNQDSYALGIHPLMVGSAPSDALRQLEDALRRKLADPRLVAVGEIGLDYFVPALCSPTMRAKQWDLYVGQLKLARRFGLPVVLHVRKSVDQILKGLNAFMVHPDQESAPIGIAHAFNGSDQQALRCIASGLCLGFGGAMTYERAVVLRHLASSLPLASLVLETDAPDIVPAWLYTRAAQRNAGDLQQRNSPVQLPAIGQVLADLRGISNLEAARATSANALRALPKLAALVAEPKP